MASTRGRQVVIPLTNKSGGSVAAGDVVVVDTSNDTAFTTTTSGRAEVSLGVAQETIANNATGRVLVAGYAALVNVPASVTRGHYIETHTVAKQATGNSTRRSGSFGQFLTGGTTPTGWIWASTDTTAGGASVATVNTAASGDTTIVNTATFYDGVSESFAAGTWLVGGTLTVGVIVSTSQNYVWSWRLWDGTNIFMEGEFGPTTTGNLNGQFFSFPIGVMIVTLGGTTTLKISVSCIRGSSASAIKRNIGLNTGTSNKATQITGYKVT